MKLKLTDWRQAVKNAKYDPRDKLWHMTCPTEGTNSFKMKLTPKRFNSKKEMAKLRLQIIGNPKKPKKGYFRKAPIKAVRIIAYLGTLDHLSYEDSQYLKIAKRVWQYELYKEYLDRKWDDPTTPDTVEKPTITSQEQQQDMKLLTKFDVKRLPKLRKELDDVVQFIF